LTNDQPRDREEWNTVSARTGQEHEIQLKSAVGLWKLLSLKGIGPKAAVDLAKKYRTWSELASARPEDIERGHRDLRGLDEPDISLNMSDGVTCVFDEDYPSAFRELADPPAVVLIQGTVPPRSIAVIGSRDPSDWGKNVTREVTRSLCSAQFPVVSGLAPGVDSIAHETCLESSGVTIGIPEKPLQSLSRTRQELAQRIIDGGGVIITELQHAYHAQAAPIARDRLVAALSSAVIITEAETKSGTMHTARYALKLIRPLVVCEPTGMCTKTSGNAALLDPDGADPKVLHAKTKHDQQLIQQKGLLADAGLADAANAAQVVQSLLAPRHKE
jgi:DNA processing protein